MDFKEILKNKFTNVLFDEPMKKHTTFKIGGNADIFLSATSVNEVIEAVRLCEELKKPYYIIGNGSNILVGDGGFRGAIIQIFKNMSNIETYGNIIRAEGGALLSSVSKKALEMELSGLEFAAGIPGTVGGGVCMNAGAYGGEMKDVISKVKILKNGSVSKISNEESSFEYRNSRIMKENAVVLETEIILQKGNAEEIKEKMITFARLRNEKQPLEFPSAGSTFKRPEGHFAGKLIMDSGLKGYCEGAAAISEKHCGFIINKGGATARDVIKLIEHVKETVNNKFGVKLEPEIKFIGEFL